jgi:hypothetical protein
MLTEEKAKRFAIDWINAWNAHDLNRILSHYSSDVVFSSPFVEALGAGPSGSVRGCEALRAYFSAALGKYPDLQFQLRAVCRGVETVTLVYDSVDRLLAAETMLLDHDGQVTRVWAQYDSTRSGASHSNPKGET